MILILLAYLVLFLSSFCLSTRLFNLAMAMGGKLMREAFKVDLLFAASVCGVVWSLKTILA